MHIESLDKRLLFSVTVAEGYTGFYEITGDDNANIIEVTVSQQNNSFTLNGQTYGNVSYIAIYGHGGGDTISVLATDGVGQIGAGISGHGGKDTISLNFDGAIWGGDGDDDLLLLDSFRGEAYGQSGNDLMTIGGETVDAEILGGSGNDTIDARRGNYGLTIRGGDGDDIIYGTSYGDMIFGDAGTDTIYGGDGDDEMWDVEYAHGGGGYDFVYGSTPIVSTSIEYQD